ncbi:Alginate biosynthesis transcriptional regulatory protein AlgB [Candidatus Magnetaquicoccaceae bacterium FCR-1]|uniref:Alginate biosynthesis transcriptional regulatory protein AlgB n=1 Tax=Candidatus Magnetaquiglobus chichijimensis TaxID=3141448 RepID=A0ABQ0CB74_9PROT
MPPLNVLIIDDEKNIRATLGICLKGMECRVTEASTVHGALEAVAHQRMDLVFLDLRLGADNGLDAIPHLLAIQLDLIIVVITAYATLNTAVEAVRRGARDYLAKPFTPEQIRALVGRLTEHRALTMTEDVTFSDTNLETNSPRMHSVLDLARRAASSDVVVLLRGENGTGKGVLAQALHFWSARKQGPFVVVNCPTLSGELLASELFGHARGAFTGAVRDQPGRVESAEGGTLFLDEIGELPPALQSKLLRFLQDRRFERIGEHRTRESDARLVAATNRDLERDVANGLFREDLLHRINVVELVVPPLRERPEDLLPMARRFLSLFAHRLGRPPPELSSGAAEILQGYAWPGNVRELRNAMERAVTLWPSQRIDPEALPERVVASAGSRRPRVGGDYTLEALEREHILQVITRAQTLEEAADILGVDASTLWRKRRRYLET